MHKIQDYKCKDSEKLRDLELNNVDMPTAGNHSF